MRTLTLLATAALALPLSAQAWDLRLEIPEPKGQSLPDTFITGAGDLISQKRLDTGKGFIATASHRIVRVGPVLKLEWGAEYSQLKAEGQVQGQAQGFGKTVLALEKHQTAPGHGEATERLADVAGFSRKKAEKHEGLGRKARSAQRGHDRARTRDGAHGVAGFVLKRNIITIFMSIELMLNAVNLSFVAFAAHWQALSGQVFVFFVMVVAAAEAAVGLGIIIAVFRTRETLNVDRVNLLKL